MLLAYEADTAAYFGRLTRARDFSRRAIVSADRVVGNETVAGYEVTAALREALFGDAFEARQQVASTLQRLTGRNVRNRSELVAPLRFPGSYELSFQELSHRMRSYLEVVAT